MSIKQIQFWLFSATVSVAIFGYLLTKVSLEEVWTLVTGLSWHWVGLFLFFSVTMSLFRTWRYQLVLNVSGYRTGSLPLFLVTLVRNFFSDLLPARLGTLVYVYLVRTRLAIPLDAAMSSFAHALIFDVISLALLIFPALAMAGMPGDSVPMMLAGGALLAIVSIGLLLTLPWLCRLGARLLDRFPLLPGTWRRRLAELLRDTGLQLDRSRKSGCYWRLLCLSFGVRCCKYASYYVLFVGLVLPLGFSVVDFPIPRVFLGLVSAELAASLPISGIAGFGVYEGAWALVFQLLGYSEQVAILTSISHHLITQVYGYALGAAALLLLLLPLFAREKPMKPTTAMQPSMRFWPKFAALVIAIVTVTALLLPGPGPSAAPAGKTAPIEPSGRHSFAGLNGRVVYEQQQSILVTDIATGTSFRLAADGRVPRWSPNGRRVVYLRGNQVVVVDADGQNPAVVAQGQNLKTLVFGSDNRSVYFADGNQVRRVDLRNRETTVVIKGVDVRELDIDLSGTVLVTTEKGLTGYQVRLYDLADGTEATVSRGCSASLDPRGQLVTTLASGHQILKLYDTKNLQRAGVVKAPPGQKFDNHFWSNHPHYLASTQEGERHDILIHHVPSGDFLQVTNSGRADRADLFIDRS